MTDKKQMSVNESLAEVNKILRSAGNLRSDVKTALSILADIACQQQDRIYEQHVYAKLNSRRIDRLNEYLQRGLITDEVEHSIAEELLQVVDELSTIQVSGEDHARAQDLYFFVQDKVRALIGENDTLRENKHNQQKDRDDRPYIYRANLSDKELINFLEGKVSDIAFINSEASSHNTGADTKLSSSDSSEYKNGAYPTFSAGQRIEILNGIFKAVAEVAGKAGKSRCEAREMKQILDAYQTISESEE